MLDFDCALLAVIRPERVSVRGPEPATEQAAVQDRGQRPGFSSAGPAPVAERKKKKKKSTTLNTFCKSFLWVFVHYLRQSSSIHFTSFRCKMAPFGVV